MVKNIGISFAILWGSWGIAEYIYGQGHFLNPIFELMVGIFGFSVTFSALKNCKVLRGLLKALFGIFVFAYFAECVYYSQTGEWISTLALENIDQLYLLLTPEYVLLLLLILMVTFLLAYKWSGKLSARGLVLIGFLFLVSIPCVLVQNGVIKSHFGDKINQVYLGGRTPLYDFNKKIVGCIKLSFRERKIASYPFEKKYIYQSPLPFSVRNKSISNPNIILIFTEGTSARLIGCYNKKYQAVTPNIDKLANNEHSMKVINYFNHTCATFRGTHGQLSSCFPRSGGWEKGGWQGVKTGTGMAKKLSQRSYQTLPKLLNANYDTIFLSPHMKKDAYTELLNMLGFANIYTRDDADKILMTKPMYYHESLSDSDMYKELENLLDARQVDKPFFLAMYTFGTHTNIDVPSNGEKFGIGKNETLNTLHNVDSAFGKFWNHFVHSKYRDNTIVIFTADHCHYHDKSFLSLVSQDSDYIKVFYDKIPLIIYDPVHKLPREFDAKNRSSLDLTPTICQLLGVNNVKNSFCGTSIFEHNDSKVTLLANGFAFYGICDGKIKSEDSIPKAYKDEFLSKKEKG